MEHFIQPVSPIEPDAASREFYVDAMRALDRAKVPYVVGGGYAVAYYTGIRRNTKDLDLFICPGDRDRALSTLSAKGYQTEFFFPFWIAKAIHGSAFIDLLYSSGNGICTVDRKWIDNATPNEVLGYPTRLVPAEEQLWSKAFVQDRDRFDGADVHHLLLGRAHAFDWQRLLRRFNGHERVLLSHLMMFGYAYPTEKHRIPGHVMEHLFNAVRHEPAPPKPVCRGTLVAHRGYGTALSEWGFGDARLKENGGTLTTAETSQLPPP